MKLSKQERIALIVVVVLVVLAAGFFLLIKPKIDTISDTKATLEQKEAEYNLAVEKAARKDGLRTEILAAYDKGKNMADMFYPELAAYQADYEIRDFLDKLDANILVEEMSVTEPSTATISSNLYVPTEVVYALKEYVNRGISTDDIEPRLIRQSMIQLMLGEPQTIGATTVTLHIKAEEKEELFKFVDALNSLEKSENGKNVRKAVELDNLTFTDVHVDADYKVKISELQAKLDAAADKENNNGSGGNTGSGEGSGEGGEGSTGGTGNGNGNDKDEEEVLPLYDYLCTVTFYSIERMKDPTPELDAQDKAV